MSSIYSDTAPVTGLNKIWKGIIQTNAVLFSDKLMITIPDLDPSLRLGPCSWMPRDAVSLPSKGDDCLVILDNDREPWVVAWWPF